MKINTITRKQTDASPRIQPKYKAIIFLSKPARSRRSMIHRLLLLVEHIMRILHILRRHVPIKLDDLTLHMHIRLSQRERIHVVLAQVGERVVHETVRGLVGANGVDDVEHRRVWAEAPVVLRDLRSGFITPVNWMFD